jgi:hypothetical protein
MKFDLTGFRSPPAASRPMPLWTWNGKVTKEFIRRELKRFHEEGFGGVFIHPRAGLETEYLSDEWFDLWNEALQTAKKLGMQCNVYDEDTYPSATAGGHVFANFPHACAQYAVPHKVSTLPLQRTMIRLATFDLSGGEPQLVNHQDGAEGDFLVIELRKGRVNPWTAGFPFVDTCQPQVAETFIEVTHEQYLKRFGKHFGKEINWFFADEPTAAKYEQHDKSFITAPMSRLLLREFERDHGYDLVPKLCDLFVESPTAKATRFDYYMTLHRVWTTNFMRPISEWCEKHGVAFTGHLMEHEWPAPVSVPNCMAAHRWFQTPGVDMLGFQYHYNGHAQNNSYLLMIKEVASVADQLGRERVLSETQGGGGHSIRFEQFKELCDWQMVHGINFVNPHMCFETLSGARKYDWPQTFTDHSPWFDHCRPYTDHAARLSEMLTRGQRVNRVLLLHPTSSAWLVYSPLEVKKKTRGVEPDTSDMPVYQTQTALIQLFADRQMDFDLGDELIMAELAKADGARLTVGKRTYDAVVLPEHMDNWCESTLPLIEKFLAAGGTLYALRNAPLYINGREDRRPADLQKKFAAQWNVFSTRDELVAALRSQLPPRITQADGSALPERVYHQYRDLGNGTALHMLVNNSPENVGTSLRFAGHNAVLLDTASGESVECPAKADDSFQTLEKTFTPFETVLLLTDANVRPDRAAEAPGEPQTVSVQFKTAEPDQPNSLMLDYCDLTLPSGKEFGGISVMDANERLWSAQGFDQNIWDRAIQFRNTYSRFTFDEQSGFSVRYRFTCESVPADLRLAVERPHLYTCTLNGKPLDFSQGEMWFDEEIRRISIAGLVQPGENVLELSLGVFDIHCEIERVYLTGDFSVQPAGKGFAIAAPVEKLELGDWTAQGLRFYRGNVTYRFSVEIPENSKHWKISLPDFSGALAKVELDGRDLGYAAFPPYTVEAAAPKAGTHELAVTVVGDLSNLLGPHFTEMLPQYFAWRVCPGTLPPGKDYKFYPHGLNTPPDVQIFG